MKYFELLFIVIISALLTGCTSPKIKSIRDETPPLTAEPVATNYIDIKADGFSPASISIFAGDTVTFQNSDSKSHEVASDPYPKDDILPDFHSGTLYKNETYQYTFRQTGTYGYHLEDNPSVKGEVIVNP
jgi:plastocyanin